jgi:hypothetical protein
MRKLTMPEVVTKYPDVLLQELKDAGGKCGVGAKQKILTKCPVARFCDLPTGEICVYGLEDIRSMTQITPGDFVEVVGSVPSMFGQSNFILLILIFGIGVAVGLWTRR